MLGKKTCQKFDPNWAHCGASGSSFLQLCVWEEWKLVWGNRSLLIKNIMVFFVFCFASRDIKCTEKRLPGHFHCLRCLFTTWQLKSMAQIRTVWRLWSLLHSSKYPVTHFIHEIYCLVFWSIFVPCLCENLIALQIIPTFYSYHKAFNFSKIHST